jgi:potassium-transporting ATPase KdpC subunit
MIAATKVLLLFTILTGVIYPVLVTGFAQVFYSDKANGSLLEISGKVVGSELISQNFSQDKYFKPRPSAVDHDPTGSGATNLSITSKDFRESVSERALQFRSSDLLTSSASGLDPHITPQAALEQMEYIVQARELNEMQRQQLIQLIESSIEKRTLGFMGNERINVLMLNLKMDELL